MCQIQFIMPLSRKINNVDKLILKKCLLLGGVRNSDAWGVTDGKKVVKHSAQFEAKDSEHIDKFVNAEYLIGHNRLATQGETAQPIKEKDWIIVHNGVFSDYSTGHKKKSDTKLFAEQFVESNKDIPKFMETVSGSYSMFFVKNGNELYYVKNSSTQFTFALVKDKKGNMIIIGSTDESNIEAALVKRKLYGFYVNDYTVVAKFKPRPLTVYKIDKENGIQVYKEFEDKTYTENSWSGWNSGWSGSSSGSKCSSLTVDTGKVFDPETWTFVPKKKRRYSV